MVSKTLSILIPSRLEDGLDGFVREVEKLGLASEIVICHDRHGRGKGWAIRQALEHSTGDLIAFIDGDGDIKPRMLRRLMPFLEDFDVVVGSKRITHSPPRRKVMTRLTRIWFKILFGVKVDTQTGIKLFRREVFSIFAPYWKSNGFIFDVEIIANLQKAGFNIVEVPIECEIRKQLAFKTIIRIFMESLWLRFRL